MKPLNTPSTSQASPDDFLTSRDVTKQFRLSAAFLSALRCKGEGPRFTRLGRRKVLYRRADVEAWLKAHEVETNPAC
ncbi:helix-turn-helix transcriptional regulator [Mesoterricola sediminis]|uniref:Helix-turn-helix domain-containing protein n=1 Tax=Mesoterricola sediminis TaxID=2927980 RepID=A0AA48H5Y3_9BACT|nr:helix-turn-helix domain-containing protein [Mesoterricola sediminis]BDU77986.1 hypothetical protein METESE_29440 [Mesoterricola sediminis]